TLSDLLVPWATIEAQLRAAAGAGLALALFNPRSAGRPDHLARAAAVLAETLDGATPVAVVTDATGPAESLGLTPLAGLDPAPAGAGAGVARSGRRPRPRGAGRPGRAPPPPPAPGAGGVSLPPVHPIEAESYRILAERVDLSAWPPLSRAVVTRVIHAAADVG